MISRQQLIVIVLVFSLGVLLYFLPHHAAIAKEEDSHDHQAGMISLEQARNNASEQLKPIYDRVVETLETARKDKTASAWKSAGDDLLKAARYVQDAGKPALYDQAIHAFQDALALDAENLAIKTALGTAMVEGSTYLGSAPMQGISLIREVLAKDSTYLEAHLQLGLFSLTSRQFDKAVERFSKVLNLDTSRIDMYVYLGDTYAAMGDKDKAVENFEKYKSRISDTLIINNINSYIKNLKNQP